MHYKETLKCMYRYIYNRHFSCQKISTLQSYLYTHWCTMYQMKNVNIYFCRWVSDDLDHCYCYDWKVGYIWRVGSHASFLCRDFPHSCKVSHLDNSRKIHTLDIIEIHEHFGVSSCMKFLIFDVLEILALELVPCQPE